MTGRTRWPGTGDDHAAAKPEQPVSEAEVTGASVSGPPVSEAPVTEAAVSGAPVTAAPGAATTDRRMRGAGYRSRAQIIRRRFKLLLLMALITTCAVGWAAGFVWFLNVTERPVEPPPYTDGIVALTGGAGRVELGLRLLASGQANRLLLSGIGGGTELATLGRLAGVDTARFSDRVTLGRYAASTRGNGVETAAWAEQNRIKSLVVVTAGYHMLRALAELRQALPDVLLYPLPVYPVPLHAGDGERGPGLRLEAEEYTKYLLTVSGLSAWLPRREPVAVPGLPAGAGG